MRYMDAAYPHYHIKRIYLDGQFIPHAAAADSEAGWVDEIVMIDGYMQLDGTGRPKTVRRYGNVYTTSSEGESMDMMLSFISAA